MKLVREAARSAQRAMRNPVSKRALWIGGLAAIGVVAVGGVILYEKNAQAAQPPIAPPSGGGGSPPAPPAGGGGAGNSGGLPASGGGGGDTKTGGGQGMQMYTCLPGDGSCVTDPSQCAPDQTAIPTQNCA